MKHRFTSIAATLVALLAFSACATKTETATADPAQIAKITAVATAVAQTGATVTLQKNPESRAALLAVAEAIEQAAALPDAPQPNNLVNLASAAASKYGGPYGALAGVGLQAGFALYQQLYAANTANALDKQPAFKAVLLSMAGGIRAAVQATPAAGPVDAVTPQLSPEDFVLKPARR